MQSTEIISIKKPNVFSGETLKHTFCVLRDPHPNLALQIQNQMQGGGILTTLSDNNRDYFLISLAPNIIGKIVDALTRLGESYFKVAGKEHESLIGFRELLIPWIQLTEWLIEQGTIIDSKHRNTLC